MFTSCSDDDLDNKSIIVGNTTTETPFDKWLTSNYVEPYNIQFLWRYNHNETDMQYYNIPADYNQAVELAHIVKYCCMEAYDRVAGIDFTRTYFPKMLYATGEFEYENNGTMILGTAEAERKSSSPVPTISMLSSPAAATTPSTRRTSPTWSRAVTTSTSSSSRPSITSSRIS